MFDPSEAIDLDAIRDRLRKMTDAELLAYGRAGAYTVSPQASYGPTRPTFLIQYAETRADALNMRVPRNLYRRMEPLVINVQFISAVDKSVTGGLQARIQQPRPAQNGVIKQYR